MQQIRGVIMKKFKTESQRVLDLMINSIYTNKEIFLRELLSNCSDAIDKLYYKSLTDNISGLTRNDFFIEIKLDKQNRTITITDNGIGMTELELETNLGTIAKSGSFDFKANENLKEQDINIIGQFGVGFYSAFMVSKKVEVLSKAYGESKANLWTSNGASGYEIKSAEKKENGTQITLYLKDNTESDNFDTYLEEYTIRNLVKKYSDYIRYPIKAEVTKYKTGEENKQEEYKESEVLNSMTPIWKKAKSEVKKEEYNSFYQENFYDSEEPIKTIHMSVEGAVDFKALLFIPKKAPFNYYSKNYEKGLKLYTNGVMIMEKCSDLLGDHFSFVKGLVDSEVMLNVSREAVQQTRQIKAIAQSIEKKVKSELLDLLKNDRAQYEEFFKAFGLQLKFGIYQSFGMNKELLQDLLMFYSLKQEKLITLKEYVESATGENIYYVCGKTQSAVKNLPQVEKMLSSETDVLLLSDDVDEFAIKFMAEYDKKQFKNVTDLASENADEAVLDEDKAVISAIKEVLGEKVTKVIGTTKLNSHAVCLSSEGEISLEMEKVLSLNATENGKVKANKVLEINLVHPLFTKLKALDKDSDAFKKLCSVIYSQALLIAGLEVENLTETTDIIFDLISK